MNTDAMYIFIQFGLIFVLLLGFAFLFALAIVVRDVDIIKKSPLLFIIETILVSLLPAIPIFFFVISREISFAVATAWVYGLSIKFAVFHVLFQVSGFYTYMFS